MKGLWCYFRDGLTEEYCDLVLNWSKTVPALKGKIGIDGGLKENLSVRSSTIRFIQNHECKELDIVRDRLWLMMRQANNDFFQFNIHSLDFMQVAEYHESYKGFYNKHQDTFWLNNSHKHRKLTCIVQLTDPDEYEGGDIELFDTHQYPPNNEIRRKGTVLFFPSFVYHQVNPVTKGKRESLTCWFEGPCWT
jgi:PKHD-type hydroxylase